MPYMSFAKYVTYVFPHIASQAHVSFIASVSVGVTQMLLIKMIVTLIIPRQYTEIHN